MDPIDFSNSDFCHLILTGVDEYNRAYIEDEDGHVPCLFRFGMSQNTNYYIDNVGTDAHCYIDLNVPFVEENMHRLEGMYLIFNRYGEDICFLVSKSIIGRTLITENKDNCIHLFLKKATMPSFYRTQSS